MRASMHGEAADTRSIGKRWCLHTSHVHSRWSTLTFPTQTDYFIQLHYELNLLPPAWL